MAKRNEKGSLFLLVVLAAVTIGAAQSSNPLTAVIDAVGGLLNPAAGGYVGTKLETAVRGVVEANRRDVLPGLVRLLFHDAFVMGCDGSVLLKSTPTNPEGTTEKNSDKNGHLRGLEMIQEIRDAIFKAAQKNISCADAIVFGAREATFLLSNRKIEYPVDGPGRLDGVVSSKKEADKSLPGSTDTFEQLKGNFTAKGFTVADLVALSATHSVGVCHKPSFKDRFNLTLSDPNVHEIDGKYQQVIIKESAGKSDDVAFMNNLRDMGEEDMKSSGFKNDGTVNTTAVNVMDISYYIFNLHNMMRFKSDWELRNDKSGEAGRLLEAFKVHDVWKKAFIIAMTKLSNNLKPDVTKVEKNIRVDCTRVNP